MDERIPFVGACRLTESVRPSFFCASFSIMGTRPQVERLMLRMPMFTPCGQEMIDRKSITLSKLSSGSPMPISTMCETRSPVSAMTAYISPAISPAVRFRTRPPCVEAQKRHPMRQPTCVDTHTELP